MDRKKINMLIQLRRFVIDEHDGLDGQGNSQALCRQVDVANIYASIIASIDDIIRDDVEFQ